MRVLYREVVTLPILHQYNPWIPTILGCSSMVELGLWCQSEPFGGQLHFRFSSCPQQLHWLLDVTGRPWISEWWRAATTENRYLFVMNEINILVVL